MRLSTIDVHSASVLAGRGLSRCATQGIAGAVQAGDTHQEALPWCARTGSWRSKAHGRRRDEQRVAAMRSSLQAPCLIDKRPHGPCSRDSHGALAMRVACARASAMFALVSAPRLFGAKRHFFGDAALRIRRPGRVYRGLAFATRYRLCHAVTSSAALPCVANLGP